MRKRAIQTPREKERDSDVKKEEKLSQNMQPKKKKSNQKISVYSRRRSTVNWKVRGKQEAKTS